MGEIVVEGIVENVKLKFSLMNIHFHTISEHTINNQHRPIEMHMVHFLRREYTKYTKLDKLVIAVFFSNDDDKKHENKLLKEFNLKKLKVFPNCNI